MTTNAIHHFINGQRSEGASGSAQDVFNLPLGRSLAALPWLRPPMWTPRCRPPRRRFPLGPMRRLFAALG